MHEARELFRLRFYRLTFGLGLLAIVLAVVLPAWKVLPGVYGSEIIPIHYNIHYGVDRTGPWWRLFTLPAIGLALWLVNVPLTAIFSRHERMLGAFVAGMTLVIEAFLLLAMIFVILLNLSYG
ncbi:MAG: hypothetical protein NUV56_03630 [Candidatus Uhrbacteria bacterium]|nr:hypothetical protein [Candidatus Uhrbacteria bacterium]